MPDRIIVLSTPLQAIVSAAAHRAFPSDGEIGVFMTSLFEAGTPPGTELVDRLFPEAQRVLCHTQHELHARLTNGSAYPFASDNVEIWSANPTQYFTRQLLRHHPHSMLTLTEDGLATQLLNVNSTRRIRADGLGLPAARVRLAKHGIHWVRSVIDGARNMPARRLARVITLLEPPAVGGAVEVHRLSRSDVSEVLNEIDPLYPDPPSARLDDARSVVVLGQIIPAAASTPIADAYVQVLADLDAQGFRIHWKPHPRDPRPEVMDDVFEEFDVQVMREQARVPMEVFVNRHRATKVIGAASASLVYGRVLFETPTFRIPDLAPSGPLGDLLVRYVPDYSGLLRVV